VHVAGVYDHVTVGELGPEGVLKALRTQLSKLETAHYGEQWLGLQSAQQTTFDGSTGVPADLSGLPREQVQV
jgi:hypothetical protein